MEIVTYESIRKIQKAEKVSKQLQKIPDGFFNAVKGWFEYKEKKQDTSSLLEVKNARALTEELIGRREGKVVIAALHTVRGDSPPDNMSLDEQKLFDSIVNLLKSFREDTKGLIYGYGNVLEGKIQDAKISIEDMKRGKKTVKALTEISKFTDMDLNTYGPFKAGDMIEVPMEIAEILIKRKVAEEV